MDKKLRIATRFFSTLFLMQLPYTLFSAEACDIGDYQPAIEVPEATEEQDPLDLLEARWDEIQQQMQAIQFSNEEIDNIQHRASHQPELAGFMLACEVIRETVKKKLTLLKLNNDITNASGKVSQLIQSGQYYLDGATGRWMNVNNAIQEAYKIQKDKLYSALCHINHLLRTNTPAEITIIKENHIVHADVLRPELSQEELNEMQLESINPGEYILVNKIPVDITFPDPNEKITDIDVMLDYLEGLLRIHYHNYSYFGNPENWVLLPITKVSQLERLCSILNGTALAHGRFYRKGYKQIVNDPFIESLENKYTVEAEQKKFIPGILSYVPDFVPGITRIALDRSSELEEKHLHLIQNLPFLRQLEIPRCKLITKTVVPVEKTEEKYSNSSRNIVEVIFKEPSVLQEYISYDKTIELLNKLLININSNELQNIDLSGLPISGEAAQNISRYTSLRKLNLSECNRIEPDYFVPIIECLGEYLISLDLSHTHITSEVAMTITILKCPNLKSINLSNCSRIPPIKWTETLNHLPSNIEHIALNKNDINEEALAALMRFQHLKKLDLYMTTIPQGKLGQYLEEIVEHLESLNLGGTNVNDDDLESVIQNENLRDINIRGCDYLSRNIYDTLDDRCREFRNTPTSIIINHEIDIPEDCKHNLSRLITFIQHHIHIQTPCFESFQDESVWIDNPITNLEQLEKLTNLQRAIRLSGVYRFTFGVLRIELPKDLGNLHEDCFNFIINNAPTLRTLHLSGLANTPQQLEELLVNINSEVIESLNLSHYPNVISDWQMFCNKHYPNLNSLNLENTSIDESIVQLINQSPQLTKLNLSECPHISEEAWHNLLSQLPEHLTELEINSAKITNEMVNHFIFPQLKKLCMDNIQGTIQDYSKLITVLPENITHLSLQKNKLYNESIKPLISPNSRLRHLNLNGCPVDPMFMKLSCTYIEELHLDNTHISDKSLTTISDSLKRLRVLSIANCNLITENGITILIRTIPRSIEHLSLQGTNFQGLGCEHFARLANLKSLKVGYCKLDHLAAALLKVLTNTIENLNLSTTGYDGSEQEEFTKFTRLKELDLSSNKLDLTKGNLLDKLSPTIENLNLDSTTFDGCQAEIFSKFKNLKKLNLSNCKLKSHWKSLIENLPPSIEILNLWGSDYDGSAANHFRKLENLKQLNLKWTDIYHESSISLRNITISKVLDYFDTITEPVMPPRWRHFHWLKGFECSNHAPYTDWNNLINHIPADIERISFSGTDYDGSGYETLRTFRNLIELDLSNCKLGANWEHLLQNLPTCIRVLNLSETDYDGSNVEVFRRLENLHELNFDYCQFWSGWFTSGWSKLVSSLPNSVHALHISYTNCSEWTSDRFKGRVYLIYREGVKSREIGLRLPALLR